MMKALLKTFGVVFMVAALAACGKTDSEKAQDKVNDTNTKIARVQQINSDLSNKGLNLQTYETPTALPENLSQADADRAKDLLNEYVALSDQILDAPNTKGVVLQGESGLRMTKANAQAYLELLKSFKPSAKSTGYVPSKQSILQALSDESKAVYAIQTEAQARTKVDLASAPKKVRAVNKQNVTNVQLFKVLKTDELKKLESEAEQIIQIETESLENCAKLEGTSANRSNLAALEELNKIIRDNAKSNLEEIRTQLALNALTNPRAIDPAK